MAMSRPSVGIDENQYHKGFCSDKFEKESVVI